MYLSIYLPTYLSYLVHILVIHIIKLRMVGSLVNNAGAVVQFRYCEYTDICLQGLTKITKNLSKYSHPPAQNLNQGLPNTKQVSYLHDQERSILYQDKLNKRAQNWNKILVLLAIYNRLQAKQGTQTVSGFISHYFVKKVIKFQ